MIKLKAIDHVCLWVRCLAEAKDYYERVFGFECRTRPGEEATLVVESESVHFFICENTGDDKFLSKQHLSFEVESLERVIESLNSLDIAEYETGEVDVFVRNNYRWCEWRDPSGIRLECVELL